MSSFVIDSTFYRHEGIRHFCSLCELIKFACFVLPTRSLLATRFVVAINYSVAIGFVKGTHRCVYARPKVSTCLEVYYAGMSKSARFLLPTSMYYSLDW